MMILITKFYDNVRHKIQPFLPEDRLPHQGKVKLVIVRRLALLPCVAWIAHHSLG